MVRNYRFAGVEYSIFAPEGSMYNDERSLLPFSVDEVSNPQSFRFEFTNKLDEPSGELLSVQPNFTVFADGNKRVRYIGSSPEDAYIRVEYYKKEHKVQLKESKFPGKIGTHTVLEVIAAEHYVVQNNGCILHCSYIEHNGKAILFTAPSGTGKSTQAELWRKFRGANIINGDRAAVRIDDGKVLAEGVPFCGSSDYCKNCSLPLKAIVYLGKAPETSIRKVNGHEAFSRIWEGVSVNTWDREDLEKAFETIAETVKNVPVFYLECKPDESAVLALEKAVEGENHVEKNN